jgi:hypothetical protein
MANWCLCPCGFSQFHVVARREVRASKQTIWAVSDSFEAGRDLAGRRGGLAGQALTGRRVFQRSSWVSLGVDTVLMLARLGA